MQERAPMREHEVGVVTHYWSELGVAGVHLIDDLDVGDRVHIAGHTSDFEQPIATMEVEHHRIVHALAGQDIGIRVSEHARQHDRVYKLDEAADVGAGESAI